MKAIALILLSAWSCFGQAFTFNDLAFVCQSNAAAALTPTNLPNAISISWWNPDDYYTNSGKATWPDRWMGYTMTNATTANFPVGGTTLNSQKVLTFTYNVSWIQSINYTASQPHTVCMVLKSIVADAASKIIFDSCSASPRQYYITAANNDGPAKRINAYAGSIQNNSYLLTNVWMLLEVCYTNGGSTVFTNGVADGAAGNTGTEAQSGLSLNVTYTHAAGYGGMILGDVMTYGSVFTAADRNYISNYVRTKYGAGTVVP